LNLKYDILVSKFAFSNACNLLYRYISAKRRDAAAAAAGLTPAELDPTPLLRLREVQAHLKVGRVGCTFHVILQSKHRLITASMVVI
jgi:hypothetical protein